MARELFADDVDLDKYLWQLAGEIVAIERDQQAIYDKLLRSVSPLCDDGCVHSDRCDERADAWLKQK